MLNMTKILIIEDEEQVRKYLRKTLELQGYEVIEAPNGKIGLNVYHQESIDLIITDIIMPEKEGLEIIMELKRNFKDVKIIAITGGYSQTGPDNLLEMAKRFGAKVTIRKPFKNDEILNAVQCLLDSKS